MLNNESYTNSMVHSHHSSKTPEHKKPFHFDKASVEKRFCEPNYYFTPTPSIPVIVTTVAFALMVVVFSVLYFQNHAPILHGISASPDARASMDLNSIMGVPSQHGK